MTRFLSFAQTADSVAATSSKNEKIRLVADYLRSIPEEDAAIAAVFLTGRPFGRIEEKTLGVGGRLLWQLAGRISGTAPQELEKIYRRHGDLGSVTEELWKNRPSGVPLDLNETMAAFHELAPRRGPAGKAALVEALLRRSSSIEAKYLVKIITGDLRIGLRESLVEEAIALAYGRKLEEVQRANMLLGDIGETLLLAAPGRLGAASLRLFHPIGFMLASPAETTAEAIANFPEGAWVEDKFDGIRAQAHKSGSEVRIFSRTLDEVTEFFELASSLRSLSGDFLLDGEIVAWRDGRSLPFTVLQQRLGRKQPDLFLEREVPVVFIAFDLLYHDGDLLLDKPLAERRQRLQRLIAGANTSAIEPTIRISHAAESASEADLENQFAAALARGNEGVMIKAPSSTYTPGRRGRAWLKLKRPFATLDVVVTAVEFGHGKRRGVLSDYTFSVCAKDEQGERLVTIGKAYSGLTDLEILQLTEYFKQHTLVDEGFRRQVEPTIVIEVAFNNIQRSDRHQSGFALRFPRIVRLRPDKPVGEIDTLERVEQLYELSQGAGSGSRLLAK